MDARVGRTQARRGGTAHIGWRGTLGGAVLLVLVLLCIAGCGTPASTGHTSQIGGGAHAATATTPPTPTATPIPFQRPEYQAGVVFPRWGTTMYGPKDTGWAPGVQAVKQQTGARWIEMVLNLYQSEFSSTDVGEVGDTPSPANLAAGIRTAKQAGFSVFVVTHLSVTHSNGSDDWGGLVTFGSAQQTGVWFDKYWAALEPYVRASAQAGAEQFSIGNEYIGLEVEGDSFWNTLIQRVHSDYSGTITYNTNWNGNWQTPPKWMSNPLLGYIGVSAYQSLVNQPQDLSVDQIIGVWQSQLLPRLDTISRATGHPLLISEIGYRNATDALYQPWVHQTSAAPDPTLQAAAYEGAVRATLGDHNIDGIYFWAWENDQFAPDNLPAAHALQTIYLSPLA